jgi:hypothetical protein
MKIGESLYAQMPQHLRACFWKLPNPGSDEVVSGFPESKDGVAVGGKGRSASIYGTETGGPKSEDQGYGGGGSAARFFASFPQEQRSRLWYGSKADGDDRLGSRHPTVKPLGLLQWLCRLITPPKGTILDCFAGTGTTAEAALREGFRCTLIEREAEYLADIERRMSLVFEGSMVRDNSTSKAKGEGKAPKAPLLDLMK